MPVPQLNLLSSFPVSVIQSLHEHSASSRWVVAFSGGLDSTALLQLLCHYKQQTSANTELLAVHVHHGLSPNADAWARHCQKVCDALDVELVVGRVSVTNEGGGLEDAARRARYGVFDRFMAAGSVLWQGHHANDQAETLLLRMLRGSGLDGLAGIPSQRTFGAGRIARPLLHMGRAELLSIGEKAGWTWIEDESNASDSYDRNYIRHRVMPEIERRWPKANARMSKTAEHCSAAGRVLNAYLDKELEQASRPSRVNSLEEFGLVYHDLARLSQEHQALVLKRWFESCQAGFPGEKKFSRIWTELLACAPDRQPEIHWVAENVHWFLRRYDNHLYLSKQPRLSKPSGPSKIDAATVDISALLAGLQEGRGDDGQEVLFLDQSITLSRKPLEGRDGVYISFPEKGEMASLQIRKGGESLVGQGPVKTLLQNAHIPPWWRSRVPLLYFGETLKAVGDLATADQSPVDGGFYLYWRCQVGK